MEGTELLYSYKKVTLEKEVTKSSKFNDSKFSDLWRHLEKVMNMNQQP